MIKIINITRMILIPGDQNALPNPLSHCVSQLNKNRT